MPYYLAYGQDFEPMAKIFFRFLHDLCAGPMCGSIIRGLVRNLQVQSAIRNLAKFSELSISQSPVCVWGGGGGGSLQTISLSLEETNQSGHDDINGDDDIDGDDDINGDDDIDGDDDINGDDDIDGDDGSKASKLAVAT